MPGIYEFIRPDLSEGVQRIPTHNLSSDFQLYADADLDADGIKAHYPQLDAAAKADIDAIAGMVDAAVRIHAGQLINDSGSTVVVAQTNQWVPVPFDGGQGKGAAQLGPGSTHFLIQRISPNAVPPAWSIGYSVSAECDSLMRLEMVANRKRGGDVQLVGTSSVCDYAANGNNQGCPGGAGLQENDEVWLWMRSLAGTGTVEILKASFVIQADHDSDRANYVRAIHNTLMNVEVGFIDEGNMRARLEIP